MHESEYTRNRKKMEETSSKVISRLHHMKSFLCKTIKKTPQFCTGISDHHNGSYYSVNNDELPTDTSLLNITSDDTISSISGDSFDSGVSTLTNFSHPTSCHLRCDPSIINYVSHCLLTTHRSEYFLNEFDDLSTTDLPLAESSRRTNHDHDQTICPEDDDDEQQHNGPLTSTLIDRWYTIRKTYSAMFHEDLSVRKNELVQVLRCTHPHWIWVRNEHSQEGFIPADCLTEK